MRSGAKWPEGETNSSYFFTLEKRNGQRKSLSMLNVNGGKCTDQKFISDFVLSFYSNLYKPEFNNPSGKPLGINGLSVEFCIHFWNIIYELLFCTYNECVSWREMITTMKQSVIPLIPKPDKDNSLIENWRPITLLTIDYKILHQFMQKG